MRRERKWFLRPLDSHSEEVIGRIVGNDNFVAMIKVEHGRCTSNVFRCTEDQRDIFVRSKSSESLSFEVWTGFENGPFKRWHRGQAKQDAVIGVRTFAQAVKAKRRALQNQTAVSK